MKKFIIKIVLFSFPIIFTLTLFEISLRNIPNEYSYKNKYLTNNSSKINLLYLGNSHIYFGVNPKFSKLKSFNAANVSQSLNYDNEILKKFNNKLTNLKYIVIPIDYLTLFTTLNTGIEKWRKKNYIIYFGIQNSISLENNFELLNGKFIDNFDRIKYNQYFKKSNLTCNELGWGTIYNSKNNQNLILSGNLAAKRHTFNLKNNESFNTNLEALESIISISNKKKCKIIFITCPAFKTYYNIINKNQFDTTVKTITDIISKNKNCYYYDLLKDKSFVKLDFYDADHLNEIGAKKFTIKIDSLVNLIKQ